MAWQPTWLFRQPVFLRCKKCWTLTDEIRYGAQLAINAQVLFNIYICMYIYICMRGIVDGSPPSAANTAACSVRWYTTALSHAAMSPLTPFHRSCLSSSISHTFTHEERHGREQLDRILRLSFSNDYRFSVVSYAIEKTVSSRRACGVMR